MKDLDRFTVCLEKGLLARLDAVASERGYPSRSRAMADFIRRAIVKKEWKQGGECAGTISVVYDASGSAAGRRIEALLSEKRGNVLSAQTHLLRGGRIMVTAAVSGRPAALQRLADGLRAVKGVTHGAFSIISPL
ncbi:MAG TPA: CopG family ribbon-helix-helix protein [Elusimicrobiales bacterium]|nr:CopG family ribbon-helix-helix protein [Elusimicrobiales bacterium]